MKRNHSETAKADRSADREPGRPHHSDCVRDARPMSLYHRTRARSQGSGPSGFFAPSDIQTAYGVSQLVPQRRQRDRRNHRPHRCLRRPQYCERPASLRRGVWAFRTRLFSSTVRSATEQQMPTSPKPVCVGLSGGGRCRSGWDVEESLDVEWAHSMAPGATIVLVEADSASGTNLNSCGGFRRDLCGQERAGCGSRLDEFWRTGGYAGETNYDADFSPVTYPTSPSSPRQATTVPISPAQANFQDLTRADIAGPP